MNAVTAMPGPRPRLRSIFHDHGGGGGPVSASPPSSTVEPAFEGTRGVILFADDDRLVRTSMTRFFRNKTDFEVVAAENGLELIELFRARAQEVLVAVLDIQMPELDGVQTYEKLRELCPDVSVPFISGYYDKELDPHLNDRVRLLQKPFPRDALVNHLKELVAEPEPSREPAHR